MGVTIEGPSIEQLGKSIGAWVKENTIALAETSLRAEVARGFDNQPVVITDGTPRRDYLNVRPFGKIEFVARHDLAEAVRWALTELQRKSPVLTGRYASSHVVLLNGKEIEGNIWDTLRKAKSGTDRVRIVNPQPYARKIERATASKKTGRGARKALSRQARSGVYQPVLRALVNRFGRSMFFDFKYVKLSTGLKVWGKSGGSKSAKRVQRDQVYPALQFFIKGTGLPN
jgi:hypothetical protein